MKKALKITSLLLCTVLICLGAACTKQQKAQKISLNISVAASLKDAMDEVKKLYAVENTSITINLNYASSGALQQQIEQGAEVDLFISAAPKQMDALADKGLILKDTRKDLFLNDVVLIAPIDNSTITSFNDLAADKVKQIALGEPKSVPAGQYAEEVFKKLGILDKVKSKAVYGKDVKEVLVWVETGNADAGIVYATDAKVSNKVKVVAVAAGDSHTPVIYPAAVVKTSKKGDTAKDFMRFLSSEKARAVFEKLGFKINTK